VRDLRKEVISSFNKNQKQLSKESSLSSIGRPKYKISSIKEQANFK
jgi:hypothetical protein